MAVKFRDYYEVLGVPRTATPDDVKRAYRQLARKHHPDLQPPAERAKAAERFKEINEAYEVLGDPEKRAKYDALGANWKGGMDFTPPPGTGWAPADASEWEDLGGVSDFFASLFGRGRAQGGRGGTRIVFPGRDIEAELPVTVDELLRGGRRRITIDGGGGGLEVEIPPGAREGTVLRLAGKGEPSPDGGPPGDLYLRVRLVPHPRYRVAGDDIAMDLRLWPWQAVLGGEVRIETPDGPVTLTIPVGTQSGRRLRLRGRGLPRGDGGRGDLHAIVRIVVPEAPSPGERAAYEALKRAASAPADRPAGG
ncbi:MAG TPA: DnaJ C-terminal domain-containing protein [Methylomirabilota bacterium]|nr:DnaJ C-terminal domain-containing protein [Methylomirabilota bacterium]